MRIPNASRLVLVGFALLTAAGHGCGGGAGCGGLGLAPLPKDPGPWGFPQDQTIEGGMQARITKPGFGKISALIPALVGNALPSAQKPLCFGRQDFKLEIAGTGAEGKICDSACGANGSGCPISVALRPDIAPPGGIAISVPDGNNPIVDVNAAFDVHMEIPIQYRLCLFGACTGWNSVCDLHIDSPATHVDVGIQLGTNPGNGELTIALGNLQLLGLNLQTSNCGIASDLFNFVLGIVNGVAKSFIGNTIIGLLKPVLSNLIQGFLPNPLGVVGSISTASALASFNPPKEAALEALIVPGGYVSAKSGGLNLGVIAGINSDRDPSTRGPGQTSDPSLCVPTRPAIDVSGPPWNIPAQPDRHTHALAAADPFAGTPDPLDMNGMVEDIAIGVSRSFLDVAGFHIYNSGTLCLSISGGVLSALNAGSVGILVPSLGNILENKKAPVALTLRPEQPLRFRIGSGTKGDPLLNIGVTDLRADFYTFIEERYVRLFTLALDLNVGVDLMVTMDANGKPALAPTISGIDATSVQARVANTDLLQEDPKKLAKSLLGLIGVAVGQIGGSIKPIALPSVMGFSLDGLQITRVQTPEDDFLAIFGSLAQNPNGMPFPLPREVVAYEKIPNGIETTASIIEVAVPPAEVIRAAVENGEAMGNGDTPSVTLALGASASPAEWSYRVNGSAWSQWSSEPKLTIADPNFLLQGRHAIDVRARVRGDWSTEDQTPQHLDVVIDSVAPSMNLHVDGNSLAFGGDDNVSEPSALRYAWKTPTGETLPARRGYLTLDEAWTATSQGKQPLEVYAFDESGNRGYAQINLTGLTEFHGRESAPAASSGGCGCKVGGNHTTPDVLEVLSALGLLGLLVRRRSSRRA